GQRQPPAAAGVEPGVRGAYGRRGSGGQRVTTDAWRGVAAEKAEEVSAALAGPWLVGIAIDNGLPPLLHDHDAAPLLGIAAAFAVAVGVQAVTTRMFVTMTGQVGQKVVLELRRRLFAHFLSLEVAFHEDYT